MSSESFEIIDTHLHIFDLELRKSWPNKNNSYGFPDPETQKVIYKVILVNTRHLLPTLFKIILILSENKTIRINLNNQILNAINQLNYWRDLNKGRHVYTLSRFLYLMQIQERAQYLCNHFVTCHRVPFMQNPIKA